MTDTPPHPDPVDTAILASYATHPLIAGRHFYTMPVELIDAVVGEVGVGKFDRDLLDLDFALGKLSGDHSQQIGFVDGQPILYDLLGDPLSLPLFIDDAVAAYEPPVPSPLTANHRAALQTAGKLIDWAKGVRRGYAGWLSLNMEFIREHDDLFELYRPLAKTPGMSGLFVSPPFAGDPTGQSSVLPFTKTRDSTLRRWKLLGLAGPFLPQIPSIRAPMVGPQTTPADYGVNVFIPSIFPIPDRDTAREMMESAMQRQSQGTHLQEWMSLVSADTGQKRRIGVYGRIFLLQHFWRVLWSRHARAFNRSIGKVERAFANWMYPNGHATQIEASVESVHKDLGELSKARGGPDWYTRSTPYDEF